MGVGVMKRSFFIVCILLVVAASTSNRSTAADAFGAWANGLPAGWVEQAVCDPYIDYGCVANNRMVTAAKAAAAASGYCDPYVNYKCLDAYLGDSFFTRFYRYYELEWGKGVAPTDPHAPAGSRSDAAWPPTPEFLRRCHSPNGRMAARRISPKRCRIRWICRL